MEAEAPPASAHDVVRGVLYELEGNQATMTQIADWCAASYVAPGEDKSAVYTAAQNYMKDALVTITRQLKDASATLLQALELEGISLDSVDAMVRGALCPAPLLRGP